MLGSLATAITVAKENLEIPWEFLFGYFFLENWVDVRAPVRITRFHYAWFA